MEKGEDAVQVECEIIRSQLRRVGRKVPLRDILDWTIAERVAAEQWAVAKRWSTLKDPPKKVKVPKEPAHVQRFALQ